MSDERPEQIADYMESIAGNIAPAVISGWLQKVAEHAKELCPDCGIEFAPSGFGDIVVPTGRAIDCVIESFKIHEGQAPELVRTILASYRSRLEQKP